MLSTLTFTLPVSFLARVVLGFACPTSKDDNNNDDYDNKK